MPIPYVDETTMTKNTRDYNRFSNYETQTVSRWVDNDRTLFEYWQEQAAEHQRNAADCQEVLDGTWTAEEAARSNLAARLREEVIDGSPIEFSLHSELLNAALSKIDWSEIAGSWLTELDDNKENRERKEKGELSPVEEFFGPVIFSYTRAQAIEDQVLIDVSKMASEAGIKYPTAVTAAVWEEFVRVPEGVTCQDEQGRLWDILNMFRFAAKKSNGKDILRFEVLVRNDNRKPKLVSLKAICGPGDTLDPVLTIMLPDED